MIKNIATLLVIFALLNVGVHAHARWKCPKARDWNNATTHEHIVFDNTGNKNPTCGPYSGSQYYGLNGITKLVPNAWQTLQWEESVSHKGAPFRVALLDAQENTAIVLLDHIPHNDATTPTPGTESTYAPYKINVFIPDVQCTQCSIQLLYAMTDKTTNCGLQTCIYREDDANCSGHTDPSLPACAGAASSAACKYADSCFSNYHSCVDVVIPGAFPLSEAKNMAQPSNWPNRNLPEGQYTSEATTWNTNGFLNSNYPAQFTTQTGLNLC